ncbi:MAG TPA: hypothetical protein VJQ79_06490 [Acidimicrobiia bacterium]|nr:hypothetical protein [Acidimicrobiia bacterium]
MPDVVALDSRRSPDRSLNTAVQVVAVIVDGTSRILLRHSDVCDLWELPAAGLPGGATPGEAAGHIAESYGLVPGRTQPIGGFRGGEIDTLVLGYRVEVKDTSSGSGLFLPLHLAPLNADPRHTAIAQGALRLGTLSLGPRDKGATSNESNYDEPLASMQPVQERLGPVSGDGLLAELRMDEELPSSSPIPIASFLEIVNSRLSESQGPDRAPWLERLAELMIIDGRSHVAGDLLAESFELASMAGDTETMARADIRIAELDDPFAGEMRAWWWVSRLSTPGTFSHLDIPFAYLGAFASRRRRSREADAYFRRALVLSEDPARRAWIKSSMAARPTRAARVTA